MEHTYCFQTIIGDLTAVAVDGFLTALTLAKGERHPTDDPVLLTTEKELNEYLAGSRKCFDLPVKYNGTPFQTMVWDVLQKIEYGKTVSYADIAKAIGKPTAQRAVGNAVGSNPIAFIVPCHRVIKKNGEMGNYGLGKELKKRLLKIELQNK